MMRERPSRQPIQQRQQGRRGRLQSAQEPARATGRRPSSRQRQESRWSEEKRRQRLVIAIAAVALLVIAAVPAYGYYDNFILPPRSVVTSVNDTKFTLGQMYDQLRGFQAIQESSGQPLDMTTFPFQVLTNLENNEIIRQQAPALGLTVEPTEIDREVENLILGITEEERQSEDPALLEKEFAERYTQYLDLIGISKAQHRDLVRADLLRQKLIDYFGSGIPQVQEQVHLYRLIVDTEEKSQQALGALAEGRDFSELVQELGLDDAQAEGGDGDLGWVPRGIYPEVETQVFDEFQASQPTEALSSDEGWFIYMATEKAQERQVDEEDLEVLRAVEYLQWVRTQRGAAAINRCFGSGGTGPCQWQYDWLVKQLRRSSQL